MKKHECFGKRSSINGQFNAYSVKSHLLYVSSLFPPSGTTADRVEVEHYDPYSNTWALTRPALKYVTNFTATACHGKLYVIGSCAVKYNALTMQCYNPVIGEERHP